MLGILLRILDQCRIAMDLAVKAVEFVDRKQHRPLARQFEHGRTFVGHIAGYLDCFASHLQDFLAAPGDVAFEHLGLRCTESFGGLLQQTLADIIQSSKEFRDQPERALGPDRPRFDPASQLVE